MSFSNKDAKVLQQALTSAFNPETLKIMVSYELNEDPAQIYPLNSTLSNQVYELIQWSHRTSREAELIRAAREQNHTNKALETAARTIPVSEEYIEGYSSRVTTDTEEGSKPGKEFLDEQYEIATNWEGQKSLQGFDLAAQNLSGLDLDGADLQMADLHESDLSDTNLKGANLSHANLSGANLSGANLDGADLSEADLRGAKYTFSTHWPENFDPIENGAFLVDYRGYPIKFESSHLFDTQLSYILAEIGSMSTVEDRMILDTAIMQSAKYVMFDLLQSLEEYGVISNRNRKSCRAALLVAEGGGFSVAFGVGIEPHHLNTIEKKFSYGKETRGVAGYAVQMRRPIYISDLGDDSDPGTEYWVPLDMNEQKKGSMICYPIVYSRSLAERDGKDIVMGVLCISCPEPKAFDGDLVRQLLTIHLKRLENLLHCWKLNRKMLAT